MSQRKALIASIVLTLVLAFSAIGIRAAMLDSPDDASNAKGALPVVVSGSENGEDEGDDRYDDDRDDDEDSSDREYASSSRDDDDDDGSYGEEGEHEEDDDDD